ncbi:hypothetical protein TNCV_364311 [Trichonephila clavipes]|uniref:Uncharacterized protein n=1 Tax=Trichonephila clavipes TaxID=2585209 RepID=A0A8X6SGD2_TRICX|nr:hypothetical protein TNCV_364311 [Trichonephila clavipes]
MSPVELPYVPSLLKEIFTKALWDTGAEKSFISEETYRKYFFYKRVKKSSTQIDKVVKTVEVEKVEIDLSKTKLEEKQKWELQDLFDSFQGLFSDKLELTHVLYHENDTGDNPLVVSRPYRYDRAWIRCHQIPSKYTWSMCSLNQWVQKSCGWSQQKPRVQGPGEYFPPLQFYAQIVKVKIGGVVIYRKEVQPVSGSGNFHSFPSGRT